MADAALSFLELHTEHKRSDRCIILYHCAEEGTGGTATAGFPEDDGGYAIREALMEFCRQIFAAYGLSFNVIPTSRN
jgi:hypothetical protein